MELMTEDEARQRIRGYADSRDWWIIPYVSEAAASVAAEVERRYYTGKANADFVILMGPYTAAFAHKRRMSAETLGALMGELSSAMTADEWSRALRAQDVIVVLDEEDDVGGVAAVLAFNRWVFPKEDADGE